MWISSSQYWLGEKIRSRHCWTRQLSNVHALSWCICEICDEALHRSKRMEKYDPEPALLDTPMRRGCQLQPCKLRLDSTTSSLVGHWAEGNIHVRTKHRLGVVASIPWIGISYCNFHCPLSTYFPPVVRRFTCTEESHQPSSLIFHCHVPPTEIRHPKSSGASQNKSVQWESTQCKLFWSTE